MPQRNTIEVIIRADDQASGTLSNVGDRVQTLGKIAAGGLAVLAGAAVATGIALVDMAKDASSLQGIEEAFQGIAQSAGVSATAMLKSLKDSGAGMATNRDLMLSYNKAAQMVSTTFANQLPDAMGYLAKVSSATGQDMGFMIDSLVTGVGRLSPMILDNLGIQVDMSEAQEIYAASIGKSVDQLTKQEKQTALMNQVLEKLKTNTAGMPDVAGQADTMLAQLGATFQDLRDELGKLLIPVMTKLIGVFQGLLSKAAGPIAKFFESVLIPIVEGLSSIFIILTTGDFTGGLFGLDEDHPIAGFFFMLRDAFAAISAGVGVFDVLYTYLFRLGDWMVSYGDGWEGFGAVLLTLANAVSTFLVPLGQWISDNIRLSDVLVALGIVLGSVVIPFVVSIATALAPLLLTFGAIVLAVSLLRQAWESNFLGIRTAVEDALPRAIELINEIITWIGNFIESIGAFVSEHPELVAALGAIAVAIGLVSLASGLASTAVGILTTALGILFSPVIILTALIAALLFAIEALYPGGLSGVLKDAATSAQQLAFIILYYLNQAAQAATAIVNGFIAVLQAVIDKFNEFKNTVLGGLQAWQGAGDNASTAIGMVTSGQVSIGDFLNALGNAVGAQFASGGFTGVGPGSAPAGIVHHNEYVVPEDGALVMRGDGERPVNIYFQGTGGPRNQAEADESATMLVSALRAEGEQI